MKKLLLSVFALLAFISFSFGQNQNHNPSRDNKATVGTSGQGTPKHVTQTKFTPPGMRYKTPGPHVQTTKFKPPATTYHTSGGRPGDNKHKPKPNK